MELFQSIENNDELYFISKLIDKDITLENYREKKEETFKKYPINLVDFHKCYNDKNNITKSIYPIVDFTLEKEIYFQQTTIENFFFDVLMINHKAILINDMIKKVLYFEKLMINSPRINEKNYIYSFYNKKNILDEKYRKKYGFGNVNKIINKKGEVFERDFFTVFNLIPYYLFDDLDGENCCIFKLQFDFNSEIPFLINYDDVIIPPCKFKIVNVFKIKSPLSKEIYIKIFEIKIIEFYSINSNNFAKEKILKI